MILNPGSYFDFTEETVYENVTKEMEAIKQKPDTSTEDPTYYNQVQQTLNVTPEDATYYNTQTTISNTEDGAPYSQLQENRTPKFNNTPQDIKYDSLILSDKRWVVLVKCGLFLFEIKSQRFYIQAFFPDKKLNPWKKKKKN